MMTLLTDAYYDTTMRHATSLKYFPTLERTCITCMPQVALQQTILALCKDGIMKWKILTTILILSIQAKFVVTTHRYHIIDP